MSQSLVVRIGGDITDLQRTLKGIDSEFNRVGNAMIGLGKGLTKSVTAPLVGIAAASVTMAAGFEQSMSKVRTLISDADDNLDALTDTARHWGRTTQFSASEVANSMALMGLGGMDAADAMDAVQHAINLATGAGLDLTTATNLLTGAIGGFRLEGSDAARVADVLTKANKASSASVDQLGKALGNVAGTAYAFGFELDETVTLLGIMANAGTEGYKAGTRLGVMFENLAIACAESNEAMEALGVSFFDAQGNARPLMEIVGDLRYATADMTDEQRLAKVAALELGAGQYALNQILNASEEEFSDLKAAIEGADGAAQHYGDIMRDNVIYEKKVLLNALKDLGIEIGNVFLPILSELIGRASDVARMIGDNLNPEVAQSIVEWGLLAAALGPVLIVTGKTIKIMGQLKLGMVAVKGGAKLTTVAMSKGLTPAIGALMTKTMMLTKKAFMPLFAKFAPMTTGIKVMTTAMLGKTKAFIGLKMKALLPLVIAFGKVIAIIGLATAAGLLLANLFGGDLSGAVQRFGEMFPRTAELARAAIDRIRGFWEGLRTFLRNPIRGIVNIFQRNQGDGAGNNANGTRNWEGGLTWVHERGAELINLPSGTEIIPHSLSRLMAMEEGRQRARMNVNPSMVSGTGIPPADDIGGGSHITNNFNISSVVIREEADIQRISKELYNLQNQRNRSQGVMHFA